MLKSSATHRGELWRPSRCKILFKYWSYPWLSPNSSSGKRSTEDSIHIPFGHYGHLRCQWGVCKGSATFQRLMQVSSALYMYMYMYMCIFMFLQVLSLRDNDSSGALCVCVLDCGWDSWRVSLTWLKRLAYDWLMAIDSNELIDARVNTGWG